MCAVEMWILVDVVFGERSLEARLPTLPPLISSPRFLQVVTTHGTPTKRKNTKSRKEGQKEGKGRNHAPVITQIWDMSEVAPILFEQVLNLSVKVSRPIMVDLPSS